MLKPLRDFSLLMDGFMIAHIPQSTSFFWQENHADFNPSRSAPTCATQRELLVRHRADSHSVSCRINIAVPTSEIGTQHIMPVNLRIVSL